MVCVKGIEPPTCGLGNRRSILLSYTHICYILYYIFIFLSIVLPQLRAGKESPQHSSNPFLFNNSYDPGFCQQPSCQESSF